MSVQPAPSGTAPWWAAASAPPQKRPFPPTTAAAGAGQGVGTPVTAAVFGGAGLVLGAAGFFLSSNAPVMAVLASGALVGATAGAVLGAWGLRRPLGELGVVGLTAGGLSLPLGVFELLMAASGHLG